MSPSFLALQLSRCRATPSGALVAELPADVTAVDIFKALAQAPHRLFLDSAVIDGTAANGSVAATGSAPRLGRFSFVAADPVHSLTLVAPQPWGPAAATAIGEAFSSIRTLLADLACPTIPGLPPFQGGIGGLVGYEAGLALLGIGPPEGTTSTMPLLSLHLYDVVFAFDHDLGKGWVISQGVPAKGPVARARLAAARMDAILALLRSPCPTASTIPGRLPGSCQHALSGHPGVFSTHSPADYYAMVRAGIEFVRSGDIFQVNLAQRLAVAGEIDPTRLHLRARVVNPAPFAASFDAGTARITSMSPERLLSVSRGMARMHPIKGTRRVLASPEADLFAGDDLGASAKDRAENVMIVDLVRNDLSRVCTPHSVRVEALCRLERYSTVQHLVSIVTGKLRPGLGPLDALLAALPGGSVTGAPKHRACEIISSLEPFARGAYCGSIGYLGLDGSADFNLLIRTFVAADGAVTFAAGGGITAASDPGAEHAESLHKAEGMLRVLASLGRDADVSNGSVP